jgi:hypothetical protein
MSRSTIGIVLLSITAFAYPQSPQDLIDACPCGAEWLARGCFDDDATVMATPGFVLGGDRVMLRGRVASGSDSVTCGVVTAARNNVCMTVGAKITKYLLETPADMLACQKLWTAGASTLGVFLGIR